MDLPFTLMDVMPKMTPMMPTAPDLLGIKMMNQWSPIVGQNFLYRPDVGADEFNELYNESSTQIIRCICKSRTKTHRNIYYCWQTPILVGLDLLEYLKNSWLEDNYVMLLCQYSLVVVDSDSDESKAS